MPRPDGEAGAIDGGSKVTVLPRKGNRRSGSDRLDRRQLHVVAGEREHLIGGRTD
jgi:hypothetical protein